jgi:hypothetical protein
MKRIITAMFFVLISMTIFAQANDYVEVMRTALKTEKKALVAEVMQLSDEESKLFWPIYNEYNKELFDANTKLFDIIMDFADHFESMTDEKASELITRSLKLDQEIVKIRQRYFKKFQKALPPSKVLRFYQTDNKIDALVDAQISQEIPLIEK